MSPLQNITSSLPGVFPLLSMLLAALSIHMLVLPVMWFAGWALPWPKAPPMQTVIEIDLTDWPRQAIPRGVGHVIIPEHK